VAIAGYAAGPGVSVARASFSAFITYPDWIPFGGVDLGIGADAMMLVGRWVVS
jgi:hypothetical protein